MIVLTKMNKDKFLVNHNQIEYIEFIPEAKIVMMNHDYYIVRETAEEIIGKITEYNAKTLDIRRQLTIQDNRR
ncbi:MAG: flagellar FlbD family protein [Oscillospiraceae bacterium]|nr:flagellar FlbD family protein [Oscillospiraceae bacterium]